MAQQFHVDQEVEVYDRKDRSWRVARIVKRGTDIMKGAYQVRFPDGSIAVFDEKHIREVSP